MTMEKDWLALSETWRAQAAPGIDLEAVRREALKRGRSLRMKVWAEVVMVAVYVAFCIYVVMAHDSDVLDKILFTALCVFLIVYQAYFLWLRRGELSDAGLDVHSLVELELRRCHTTLRYWRIGMWTGLAIWVALYVAMLVGMQMDGPRGFVFGLVGGLLANVVVMPALGLFALWRTRQEQARIARYRELQGQLRAP